MSTDLWLAVAAGAVLGAVLSAAALAWAFWYTRRDAESGR